MKSFLMKNTRRVFTTSTTAATTAANGLNVYGFPLSQPTRSVLMLLQDNNIKHNFVTVDVFKGEHKKAEYLSMNPQGLVPAIKDEDGFVVAECSAILQYICESKSLLSFYPLDHKLRANINFWLSWNQTNTRYSTKKILVTKLFPPKVNAVDTLNAGIQEYSRSMKFLDKHLQNNKFLVGDKPTIADLLIITELDQLNHKAFNFFDYTPYKNISRYMASVQESVQSYDKIFNPVIDIANGMRAAKKI